MMFRHTISLGRILWIRVDLDYCWFLIVGLATWVLAINYYPAEFRNWSTAEYRGMGVAAAVMLFVSVLTHELGHSLVARRLRNARFAHYTFHFRRRLTDRCRAAEAREGLKSLIGERRVADAMKRDFLTSHGSNSIR